MSASSISPLIAQALAFTEAYKRHAADPVAIREAACLRAQYPAILGAIQPGDCFAGRRGAWIAYVGTIWWAAFPGYLHGTREEGKQGGYCYDFAAEGKFGKTPEERQALSALAAFWEHACTPGRIRERWDDDLRTFNSGRGQVAGGSVGFAAALDFDRLLQRGIPGLIADIEARRNQAEGDAPVIAF